MTQSTTQQQSTRSATLTVPGSRLYYEVRGSGPTLLIIPGGPQDAGVFADLSAQLAGRYTVVAYDPRGNSRSTFDDEADASRDQDLDRLGDDAARLIEAVGNGPAYVFGTSGGGQIGLNLAARYPERVRTLLAHEPASLLMLDDPAEALAADRAIYDIYRREGVDAAMAAFFGMAGLDDGPGPDDEGPGDGPPEFDLPPEAAETFVRVSGNFEYWLAHGLLPLSLYRPDVAALRAGQPRIMVGLGDESAGQTIYAIGEALAGKLGVTPVSFPGDHMGFEAHPEQFADTLHRAFAGD